MGYWKSKVLPKIHKVFGKDSAKKAALTEVCKSFDESKEGISKEFEEKKAELQPKVVEIFEASSDEIKSLVKEPKESGLKKHSVKVQQFLDDLVKIEFPGSKSVCEASSKYGPAHVSGPIIFILEKVSTFVITEEKPRDMEPPAAEATKVESTNQAETETTVENNDKPREEGDVVPVETTAAEAETTIEQADKPKEEGDAEPEKAIPEEPEKLAAVEDTPKA